MNILNSDTKKFIVYKATFMNNKNYIGITCNSLEKRIKSHYYDAFKKESSFAFHRAIRKYGKDNIIWNILEENLTLSEVKEKECYYIEYYKSMKNGYNMTLGGDISDLDTETRSRLTKDRFINKENRNINSLQHGGKEFIGYDYKERKIVGYWISQGLCADELDLDSKNINSCLLNKYNSTGNYIFIYKDNFCLDIIKEKIKKLYEPYFEVLDISGNSLGLWKSKLSCSKSLNISRSAIKAGLEERRIVKQRFIFKYYKEGEYEC